MVSMCLANLISNHSLQLTKTLITGTLFRTPIQEREKWECYTYTFLQPQVSPGISSFHSHRMDL